MGFLVSVDTEDVQAFRRILEDTLTMKGSPQLVLGGHCAGDPRNQGSGPYRAGYDGVPLSFRHRGCICHPLLSHFVKPELRETLQVRNSTCISLKSTFIKLSYGLAEDFLTILWVTCGYYNSAI